MRTSKSILAVILGANLWVGCGDSSTSTPPVDASTGAKCTQGQSVACTAPGGCAGGQVCNASGAFDPCICVNDAGADAAGDAAGEPPGPPSGVAAAAIAVVVTVTTLAGSGTAAFADGAGAAASFHSPEGVALDAAGNVYVGDAANHSIRKVTSAGVVTTLAGSGTAGFADGTGASASFNGPSGVAVDTSGSVYVADSSNNRIRKVTPTGVTTTLAGSGTAAFADGTGAAASFNTPYSVALDTTGNLFIADTSNNRIREVTPAAVVTTLAGSGTPAFADGTGAAASFNGPSGVAVDTAGSVYVADATNSRIRKVTPAGVVTTLAGSSTFGFADGTGAAASFNAPTGVAVDTAGSVYVADLFNNRIRKVTPTGVTTTLAGSGTAAFADGTGAAASFNTPYGVALDTTGNLFIADTSNNRIRKITSVGFGQLVVTWSAPSTAGSSAIKGYAASASAAGNPTQTCTTTGATTCTISGLTGGVAYAVSVTATNAAGTSAASASATATPN